MFLVDMIIIWRFSEMGEALNHPFWWDVPSKKPSSELGVPHCRKPPYNIYIYIYVYIYIYISWTL